MRLLLVHGRGQGGKDADALKSEWIETLRRGFEAAQRPWPTDLSIDFPFYGDDLDDFVARANLPDPEDVVAKGRGQDDDFELFMQETLMELEGSHPTLSESAIRAELPHEDLGEKGIQNWKWIHAIARVIDRRISGVAEFTIEQFLKDVHLYVNRRAITKAINKIVQDKITHEPTVVIGHSLGSVVSYNVINETEDMNVVKHITVGSPLGLRAISRRLGVPTNTAARGWFNAFDPEDIVALNPLDIDHFNTDPAIENHGSVNNQTDNQHGIAGYLNDSKIAATIADAIDQQT